MNKLLECPFCGGSNITIRDAGGSIDRIPWHCYEVRCECGASRGVFRTREEAEESWNRRTKL